MDATTTGKVSVDPSILKCLPHGTIVTDVIAWAASGWSETRRLSTTLPDGESKEYFVKSNSDSIAKIMFSGEFASLDRLYSLVPSSCPKPYGWGEFETNPGSYFIIMNFLYLIPELPEETKISHLISKIYQTTAGTSLDGNKFGFYLPTCHGKIAQPNVWDDNWAQFYANLLAIFYKEDMKSNGPFAEYERAHKILIERTIPRLLGALQAEGRILTPCLVHGDF